VGTEIPGKTNNAVSDLNLKSLSVFGKLSLEGSANLVSDLVIARGGTEPHLVDYLLGRHRASYLDDLSACRL
jgi:hypothetical protein